MNHRALLEGSLQSPGIGIAEDVIDHRAGPRSFYGDMHVEAYQVQGVAIADVDAGKTRPAVISTPDAGLALGLLVQELCAHGRAFPGLLRFKILGRLWRRGSTLLT